MLCGIAFACLKVRRLVQLHAILEDHSSHFPACRVFTQAGSFASVLPRPTRSGLPPNSDIQRLRSKTPLFTAASVPVAMPIDHCDQASLISAVIVCLSCARLTPCLDEGQLRFGWVVLLQDPPHRSFRSSFIQHRSCFPPDPSALPPSGAARHPVQQL